MAAANMIDVAVPVMALPVLIRRAVAHYNARNPGKAAVDYASSQDLIARLCVNYLRHACTRYDANRDFLQGRASHADRAAIGAVIKGRTLRAIAITYPALRDEAQRQAEREDATRAGRPDQEERVRPVPRTR